MPDDSTPLALIEEPRTEIVILRELLGRITSFYNQRLRYMATVALSCRAYAEGEVVARSLIGLFDLDTAIGQALDFTGQWVGLTRFIDIEVDLWFTFDRDRLGFDQGVWMTPYEEHTRTVELGDTDYRTLLKARVVANHWDGTTPQGEEVWRTLFGETGYQVIIQDGYPCREAHCHSDMRITQVLLGPRLDPVVYTLFTGGFLGVKPAGVGIEFVTQYQGGPEDPESGIGKPLFAFDVDPAEPRGTYPPTTMAGFDYGCWGISAKGIQNV